MMPLLPEKLPPTRLNLNPVIIWVGLTAGFQYGLGMNDWLVSSALGVTLTVAGMLFEHNREVKNVRS